jgi:DNA-binding beta-propeller fold protein YncE
MSVSYRRVLPLVPLALALGLWGCNSSTAPATPGMYSKIETYAGNGIQGLGVDGVSPKQTPLYWPQDISFGPDGRVYIVDWNNYKIRVVENGIIRTLIGSGRPVPDASSEAPTGIATEVDLNHPCHVNFDALGNIILSGFHSSAVFYYDFASNMVTPLCGDGTRDYRGDGGPADQAWVNLPTCTHYDAEGNLLIMDEANQVMRIVTPDGNINTFAGTAPVWDPVKGQYVSQPGFAGDGGPPEEAKFNLPVGQAAWPAAKFVIGPDDADYIADTLNHRIRKIIHSDVPLPGAPGINHADDVITTIAGNGQKGYGGDGGQATEAMLNQPGAVALDSDGNLYISDHFNHCIRKVDTNGIITTFAGHPTQRPPLDNNGNPLIGDGKAPTDAYLDQPGGIAFDQAGNFYIADTGNNRIRIIKRNP